MRFLITFLLCDEHLTTAALTTIVEFEIL